MRIEIAGAQVTDSVVEVLDTLQNQRELSATYLHVLDEVTRTIILDVTGDEDDDVAVMTRLRTLQMIRRDIITLSSPPDADNPANDTPTAQI